MTVDTFNCILVKIEPRKSKNFVTGRGMPRKVLQLGQTLSPRTVRDGVMLLQEYYSKNDLIQLL
ncbi:hypothetical protein PoB_006511400, partial [Plakobranchus ocellatus]